MSGEVDLDSHRSPPTQAAQQPDTASKAEGLAGTIIANTTLLTAVLVYMGWAYENALLGTFNVSALSLNLSIVDYALHSLDVSINAQIIVAMLAVIVIAIVVSRLKALSRTLEWAAADRRLVRFGFVITVGFGGLLWFGSFHSWFFRYYYFFCPAILLAGVGPLLLTWRAPSNGTDRPRHHPFFPLAIVVAAACTVWAAGNYAAALGDQEASRIMDGPPLTAVYLYSAEPLGLSGDGIKVQPLHGSVYHYRYYGLRLLIDESGTYYLLPEKWLPGESHTYIIDDSDQVRIELSD
jgi:hypothetical protein